MVLKEKKDIFDENKEKFQRYCRCEGKQIPLTVVGKKVGLIFGIINVKPLLEKW